MNDCKFTGRLTRDAETKYTQSGTPVTNFSIAVDTGYGDHKRTEFIDCILWKRENAAQHLTKGKPVIVSGEYKTDEWTDREGQKRRSVKIVVRDFEFQQGVPKSQRQQPPQRQRQEEDEGPAFPSEASGMDSVPF